MKRRDLIKTGLIAASAAAALGVSGCSKEAGTSKVGAVEITPKQTDTYKFSVPLPFDFKIIDELAELNNKYKKSRITTLCNCTPTPCANNFNEWIQSAMGFNSDIKTFEDFAKYAKYAMEKGFTVCYLMDSPKPFSQKDYEGIKADFEKLLNNLASIGIKDIKVGNTQVATMINEIKQGFRLHASTTFEYHNTSQYVNLIHNYPNIKILNIAIDENQNFHLLRSLRKIFPNRTVEVVVNDSCMKGCPARISHASSAKFNQFDCNKIRQQNRFAYMFKIGSVYPWLLEYYSALGINSFQFLTRDKSSKEYFANLAPLKNYLDTVENGADSYIAKDFLNEMFLENFNISPDVKMSKLIPCMPDIKQFLAMGNKCAVKCGAQCQYCDKMAEKMKDYLNSIGALA